MFTLKRSAKRHLMEKSAMKDNINGDNDHNQKRLRLQSEKYLALSEIESGTTNQDSMRVIGTAVDNLLKYGGFTGAARNNCIDYRLEQNDVYLPDLPASFDGYTILHLSDLHADGLVDEGAGIIRIVETVPCDLAVLT